MKMSALLSRNTGARPGVTGTARVDRDIDRLLRRVGPGDIVVLDILDLDRMTADALVDANIAGVVNASPSISGRYPNLGPEVLVANNITLIDTAGEEIFKKIKDGAKIRLHNGSVYAGDRRLAHGVERSPAQPRHQRRIVTTGAQRLDLEVGRLDALGPLRNGEVFGEWRQPALR